MWLSRVGVITTPVGLVGSELQVYNFVEIFTLSKRRGQDRLLQNYHVCGVQGQDHEESTTAFNLSPRMERIKLFLMQ